MNEEEKKEKYLAAVFGPEEPKKERDPKKIKAAFKRAHEIRKFEIGLYWQRSLFFWGFVAALLIAFGAILSNDFPTIFSNIMAFCIALLGLFVSFGWYYVARGSKSWQKNWEAHIDFLEDNITGRLYKTPIGNREEFFSVSKVTQSIIRAFIIFWAFASFFTAVNILCPGWLGRWNFWFPILISFVVLLFAMYRLANELWRTDFKEEGMPKSSAVNKKSMFDFYIEGIPKLFSFDKKGKSKLSIIKRLFPDIE